MHIPRGVSPLQRLVAPARASIGGRPCSFRRARFGASQRTDTREDQRRAWLGLGLGLELELGLGLGLGLGLELGVRGRIGLGLGFGLGARVRIRVRVRVRVRDQRRAERSKRSSGLTK